MTMNRRPRTPLGHLFGSLSSERPVLWAPIYEAVLNILGPTGVIIPMADANDENAARTTVTTRGEIQAVFTYSEAIHAFDVPPTFEGPAQIPIITFNGSDEEADSPDSDYWSRGDGTNDFAFSVGAWVYITDTAAGRHIISKWTNSGNQREWRFYVTTTDNLEFQLRDESGSLSVDRNANEVVKMGAWHFYVATYDGAGGASAADTIKLYEDGVDVSGAITNNASYVAMENGTSLVAVGMRPPANGIYDGKMAGGPLGSPFTQIELTADQVLRLFQLGRVALGV